MAGSPPRRAGGHLHRPPRALGHADAAALAVVAVDPVPGPLAADDPLRAVEQAGVALRAAPAGEAARRLLRPLQPAVHLVEGAAALLGQVALAARRRGLEVGEADMGRG